MIVVYLSLAFGIAYVAGQAFGYSMYLVIAALWKSRKQRRTS